MYKRQTHAFADATGFGTTSAYGINYYYGPDELHLGLTAIRPYCVKEFESKWYEALGMLSDLMIKKDSSDMVGLVSKM